jgi:hypothetical protein
LIWVHTQVSSSSDSGGGYAGTTSAGSAGGEWAAGWWWWWLLEWFAAPPPPPAAAVSCACGWPAGMAGLAEGIGWGGHGTRLGEQAEERGPLARRGPGASVSRGRLRGRPALPRRVYYICRARDKWTVASCAASASLRLSQKAISSFLIFFASVVDCFCFRNQKQEIVAIVSTSAYNQLPVSTHSGAASIDQ